MRFPKSLVACKNGTALLYLHKMFDGGCPTLESGVLGFLYITLRDFITSFEPVLTHLPVSIAMQLVFTCTCNLSQFCDMRHDFKLVFVVNRLCTTLRMLVTVSLHLSVD